MLVSLSHQRRFARLRWGGLRGISSIESRYPMSLDALREEKSL
jgi:hypothetical protein